MPLSRARERLVQRLRTRRGRAREGLVLVEGPRAVAAAIGAGARFRFALVAPGASGQALEEAGIEVVPLASGELEALSDTEAPQGILAVVEEPRAELPAGPSGEGDPFPRVLVLDAIQDPGNVGALLRSAAAFGLDAAVVLDGSVDPWNPKAVRASAGEAFRIRVVRCDWETFRSWLASAGIPLLVADARGTDVRGLERRPAGMPPRGESRGGWALLVGNEARGPRREALEAAEALVALPLAEGVESLNAAVAGSVLLWALGPGEGRVPPPDSPSGSGGPH